MNKKDFNDISIRGRIAYGIACFSNYVAAKYPEKDFGPVLERMWNIVGDKSSIDEEADRYMEIIPEYLYEFPSYEEADFEHLSADEYERFTEVLRPDDDRLNVIMHRIYDIAMEYAYEALEAPGKKTIDYVFDIVEALDETGVEAPALEGFKQYGFERYDGWGDFITPMKS